MIISLNHINEIILKLQQRFENDTLKIAFSSNDDKRLQTFDRITSYPHGTNAGKVCKTELPEYLNIE